MTFERKINIINKLGVDGDPEKYEEDVQRLRISAAEIEDWEDDYELAGEDALKVSRDDQY